MQDKPKIFFETLHYATVEFMMKRGLSNELHVLKDGQDRADQANDFAEVLAEKHGVTYDLSYRSDTDGHRFVGRDAEAVRVCAEASAAFIQSLGGYITPA